MKKKIWLIILLALFVFLNGCNGQTQVTASSTISPTPSASPNISKGYSKAYYDVVAGIVKQYGFNINDERGFLGFLRGDLIDFDNDGVPELVCVYQKEPFKYESVCIYRYTDNKAILLVDKLTGSTIWGKEPSTVRYSYIDGKTYILTEDCVRVKTEILYIYTVENGALRTIKFTSDVKLEDNEEYKVDHYLNCQIDGKSYFEEEYRAQRNYYYNNALTWPDIKENGKYISSEKYATQFVKSLAASAGVGDSEVNALIQANSTTPTPTKAPVPSASAPTPSSTPKPTYTPVPR